MPTERVIEFTKQSRIPDTPLSKLGLTVDDFSDAALSAFQAYNGASPLNPVTFAGTAAWAAAVVALRASLSRHGWLPDDVNNQPQIISSEYNAVITVSSANDKAGVPFSNPQTRGGKGKQTELGISSNLQHELFPEEKEYEIQRLNEKFFESHQYWMYLFYIDLLTKEVRSELSKPIMQGDNGKVIGWAERIILPALNFSETNANDVEPLSFSGSGAYEVNIPISSKENE